jgi:hypothetical protein
MELRSTYHTEHTHIFLSGCLGVKEAVRIPQASIHLPSHRMRWFWDSYGSARSWIGRTRSGVLQVVYGCTFAAAGDRGSERLHRPRGQLQLHLSIEKTFGLYAHITGSLPYSPREHEFFRRLCVRLRRDELAIASPEYTLHLPNVRLECSLAFVARGTGQGGGQSIMEYADAPSPGLYQPLNRQRRETRLIHLLPAKESKATIEVELETFSLGDSPVYEAISYTWGDANDRQEILLRAWQTDWASQLALSKLCVTGINTFQPNSITTGLHGALRRLRLPDRARILWADALCINQSDIAERGHQVTMMDQVFSHAGKVIVWLGDDHDEIETHWRVKCMRLYASWKQNIPELIELLTRELGPTHSRSPRALLTAALAGIYSRQWFQRVWVLQEVSLAKEVAFITTHTAISFEDLRECIWRGAADSAFVELLHDFPQYEVTFSAIPSLWSANTGAMPLHATGSHGRSASPSHPTRA